ncbi:YHS domain-containing (seleno)protein [Flavobacterium sp. Arc3]|jgi:YHS domain-containing protein|uniref:YHS domain-containing (seleno)protein n=1 Tax=unclassified Flavobacterium TaxID=196869 RepID=UPI00352E5333
MKKFILAICMLFTLSGFAQSEGESVSQFNLEGKVAMQGYDPVAYFKEGKALEGKKEINSIYEGVIYYFSSASNKSAFVKSPSSYEPQYGGWCAFAMGDSGDKVAINPSTFKIIDGKLYLFYNAFFRNTLKSWNKDQSNLQSMADSNWKKVIQ